MEENGGIIVECPYCGYKIHNNVERCKNCKEWFVEPNLDVFKVISLPFFVIFSTSIFYSNFWFYYGCVLFWTLKNYKNFKNIATTNDLKKFKILLTLLIISTIFLLKPFMIAIEIFLSYRMLRIIEKFSYSKYGSPITHHELGMLFFRTLYVVYFIDTFAQRVKDPELRYCLEPSKWIKYSIIFLISLILFLYLIGFMNF